MAEPAWHFTPRWRRGHLLAEDRATLDGGRITLCALPSRPDEEWAEDQDCAERCGQCARRHAARALHIDLDGVGDA